IQRKCQDDNCRRQRRVRKWTTHAKIVNLKMRNQKGRMKVENVIREIARLEEWLAEHGKDPEGGVTRLLYTKEWVEGQKALENLMQEDGLTTRYDDIGNLFGRLEGSTYKDETILTGS